jgi:hypothetical protein
MGRQRACMNLDLRSGSPVPKPELLPQLLPGPQGISATRNTQKQQDGALKTSKLNTFGVKFLRKPFSQWQRRTRASKERKARRREVDRRKS